MTTEDERYMHALEMMNSAQREKIAQLQEKVEHLQQALRHAERRGMIGFDHD